MKKISKDDEAKLCEIAEKLHSEWDVVEKAKGAVSDAIDQYNEAVVKFNEYVGEARNFVVELVDKAQEYADERTERWQEGDAGSAYMTWIDDLQATDFEDLEEITLDSLELADDPEYGTALDDLPREPNA